MVYEKIEIKSGNTLSQVANDYGYNLWDWKRIWEHHGNSNLKRERTKPENLKAGDIIVVPLPWKIISKKLTPHTKGHGGMTFAIRTRRNGVKGEKTEGVSAHLKRTLPGKDS